MKKSTVDYLKNLILSILISFMVNELPVWVEDGGRVVCSICAGIFVWVFLTAYDEILRQRNRGRKRLLFQNN